MANYMGLIGLILHSNLRFFLSFYRLESESVDVSVHRFHDVQGCSFDEDTKF